MISVLSAYVTVMLVTGLVKTTAAGQLNAVELMEKHADAIADAMPDFLKDFIKENSAA